jgi:hypothetical protein
MADSVDDIQDLFARATAAISEAARLAEENLELRKNLGETIRCMHLRARFYPKSLNIYTPANPLNLPKYQPRPHPPFLKVDNSQESETTIPISDRRADSSD